MKNRYFSNDFVYGKIYLRERGMTMKKFLKVVITIAAIGAAIGGIVYFVKKKSIEDDFDDLDDFDDFDFLDDEDEAVDTNEDETENIDRNYTSINLDTESTVETEK